MVRKPDQTDIRQLRREELEALVEALGLPRFRARQIYSWLWTKGARSFEAMTDLPKGLRQTLSRQFALRPIEVDHVQHSRDGTIKTRFRLHDGHLVESVLIPVPEDKRFTACLSSQVGCSLSCKFCATGRMKRVRNLEAGEIFDQFWLVNQQALAHYGHALTNVVYMGMGEPLLAYKQVWRSIELISDPRGLNFSPRRITLSTAGIAKMIRKLADDGARFNLALSLHAADDEKRSRIMPINEQNNLAALMEALEYFWRRTRNRISYEYIAFAGFNDQLADADKLARLCRRFPVRVNIIEYNPIEGAAFAKSPEEQIDAFARRLRSHGVMVTVRRSRGRDIDAACGQLANKG